MFLSASLFAYQGEGGLLAVRLLHMIMVGLDARVMRSCLSDLKLFSCNYITLWRDLMSADRSCKILFSYSEC